MINPILGIGTIFMLHRVSQAPNTTFSPNKDMAVTPKFLEDFILDAKAKGYIFVSLDSLADAMQENQKDKLLVMTLDDGYKDNYTNAYPIFKKHNIPFTIYVTTSFPDRTAILWWYTLEELLVNNNEIKLSDGTSFLCSTADEKLNCFSKLRQKIMSIPHEDFLNILNNYFRNYSVDWGKNTKELAINWEQLNDLANEPLVTIGAHTLNHVQLSGLSKEAAIREILGSRELIESHTGKKVEHFCYPYGARGDADQREFDIVRALNFKTATTTRSANIFSKHRKHLEALPRVSLTNNFSWKSFHYSSLKRFIKGRVVTA